MNDLCLHLTASHVSLSPPRAVLLRFHGSGVGRLVVRVRAQMQPQSQGAALSLHPLPSGGGPCQKSCCFAAAFGAAVVRFSISFTTENRLYKQTNLISIPLQLSFSFFVWLSLWLGLYMMASNVYALTQLQSRYIYVSSRDYNDSSQMVCPY